MAKPRKEDDLVPRIMEAVGCNAEDLRSFNDERSVAVVVTAKDAFKVAIGVGGAISRIGAGDNAVTETAVAETAGAQ
jgi:hypothetical protein